MCVRNVNIYGLFWLHVHFRFSCTHLHVGRCWLHSLVYCAASNIFFLPSIPDMASTFFLQSLTSTVFSYKHKCRTELCHNTGVSNLKSLISAKMDTIDPQPTFSVSSFLTDLRFALRSMDTLCLEPSRERRMASAETRTLLRVGRLNLPLRSRTLMFRSLICSLFKSVIIR